MILNVLLLHFVKVEEAEILAAELAGEEADPQTKIDVLKKEELLCEEERVEEEEIIKEDMKRKHSFERTEVHFLFIFLGGLVLPLA